MKRSKWFGFLMATFVALSLLTVTDPAAYARGSFSTGGGSRPMSTGSKMPSSNSRPAPSVNKASFFRTGPKPAAPAANANTFRSGQPQPGTQEPKKGFTARGQDGKVLAQTHRTPGNNQSSVKKSPLEQRMNAKVSAQRSKQALSSYRAEQSKFRHTGSPVRSTFASRRMATNYIHIHHYRYSSADYAYRRTTFYDYYHWHPSPWSYMLYPRFGIWDTVALVFWLDHLENQQYRMAMYAHYNDPELIAFRQQLAQQAATNAQLQAKVAAMDQQMAAMRAQGVQADTNYVPPDMQQSAFSEDALKEAQQ